MKTITIDHPINLRVVKFELDFSSLFVPKTKNEKKYKKIKVPNIHWNKQQKYYPAPPTISIQQVEYEFRSKYDISRPKHKRDVKDLIDDLLNEIYVDQRDWGNKSTGEYSQGSTGGSCTSSRCGEQTDVIERSYLESLDLQGLREQHIEWNNNLQITGERLAKYLRIRDRLYRQQKKICAAFTVLLRHISMHSVSDSLLS